MEPVVLAQRSASASARCAICHDRLGTEREECPGCATVVHAVCRGELGTCPTLGCERRDPEAEPLIELPRPRRAGRLVATAIGLTALGIFLSTAPWEPSPRDHRWPPGPPTP